MAAENESSGMLEKMKRLVGGASPAKYALSGMNLPWLLARCDCAYAELLPLVRSRIFVREQGERYEYYSMLGDMMRDIIESLELIRGEAVHSAHGKNIEGDSSLPVLRIVLQSLNLLRENAKLVKILSDDRAEAENFAGTAALAKFHLFEDSAADMEVELIRNVTELLDAIAPAMQKNSEQRKRVLSRHESERYDRAVKELVLHYSGLAGKN